MTSRTRNITLLVVLGFVAFLLYSTLASQHVECTVAVEYLGRPGEGKASGASEADAMREAQTAACGPITAGMNDKIACDRVPPTKKLCRTL